ncbi:MAG TPA: oligopeptide transporter, OPT family [Thermoanaerobaculia bacterium]|nr:oligopeptide transporter, OPT family [Thermoanaerobaculia bacterium]HUM28519.1 oligopeptide transporter, OPT family [Thermoanaerobaculia bacterium]HXK66873.1 oligopeptide transporter, OPT family [Thermoanaerobaculia bacterium]
MSEFKPYVPAETRYRDVTIRALITGALFGAIFGSANAYLGLRVGLTISTSIPLAVLSVAVFKLLERVSRKTNILECNIAQTMGSASSSLASGVIFTIPALYMWGFDPPLVQIGILALLGGILGILFMIPLRPYLIVKEHHELPYPEGTAAAQVLIAADAGGARAQNVFIGLVVGAVYKVLLSFGKLWAEEINIKIPSLKKGIIGLDPTPALLGVGYILGYRIAGIMVAGGILSSLVLIPMIAHFGESAVHPLFPSLDVPISAMSAKDIWQNYVRYIGAGAVAFAGILTVLRSLPTMMQSLMDGLKGFTSEGRKVGVAPIRTQHDLPMSVVLIGAAVVVGVTMISSHVLGVGASIPLRVFGALCIVLFAFMFVTVSSRIVGLVGVTSNPTSGMAIVTLLGTSSIFYLLGWTDDAAKATVLTIGTVVCVAASIAGDISQDLKCGYIIGATPSRQQIVELISSLTSAFAIAAAVFFLGKGLGFGTEALPAPQATLMKTVIEGVLQADLPWGLVLTGASLALVASLLGVPPLPFAVGIYLPVKTMTPVFVGGVLRSLVEYRARRRGQDMDQRREKGVLLASGMIAGEGLVGVGLAVFAYISGRKPEGWGLEFSGYGDQIAAMAAFTLLAFFLVRMTRLKPESE